MTFWDTDLVRVLEEVLPSRFGGGPTDCQLVEEKTASGRSRLRLLVHPGLGPLDTTAVADAFLTAIGSGSSTEHVMELHWRATGVFPVERLPPRTTVFGKVLHLHQQEGTGA